jgi:hypothetical protein
MGEEEEIGYDQGQRDQEAAYGFSLLHDAGGAS